MMPSRKQRGMTLIILVFMVGLAATAYLLYALNPDTFKIERDKKTAAALAEAKSALLGYVLTKSTENVWGYLPNPDMGLLGSFTKEGDSTGIAGIKDAVVIGKLPWQSLGISPLKDGANECLWYAVSGHFKNNPKTAGVLNWDTQGQIDVVDNHGNVLASNLAALLVSPGHPLGAQSRVLADAGFIQCHGNYDARNFLDPYSAEDAIADELNYFINSMNNSRASNTGNKRFVMHKSDAYNDRFLFVTVDDIFRLFNRYTDFSTQIKSLLDDSKFKEHLQAVAIEGDKGTKNVECDKAANKTFCKNWLEMLLLTQLPVATPIIVDGVPTAPCSRVLIFGGQKAANQTRLDANDKNNPVNYLEGSNVTAFHVPTANNAGFNGVSSFSANNPSADILRCYEADM